MALVITLIMLSVTLVMAVAFLAIARRERNAVTTTTDTATARLATDAALASAQAQIAANILSTAGLGAYNYSLLVSTNYQNGFGFVSGVANPANVNYDYYTNGVAGPLTSADMEQNIANLLFLPRAPVFIVTNKATGSNEFRFYLDVNRNMKFEGNGPQPQFGNTGGFLHPDGTEDNNPVNVVTNFQTGDPEWIGVLERPDQPHSANNHFLARYAFLAQPIGNSLDLNYIHNQAAARAVNQQSGSLPGGLGDSFIRNQGVGSWELNLAAFLADLNTNQWSPVLLPDNNYYAYNEASGNYNQGKAFDDARALLSWRYGFLYGNLLTANQSLNFNAANVFPFDAIDGYSDGPLQTTVDTNADFPLLTAGGDNNAGTWSWAGSDNPNRYFSLLSDLYAPAKITAPSLNFIDRLRNASAGTSTYDRYTFYRMLDQLGTDSTSDDGKLNLNCNNLDPYIHIVAGVTITNSPSATNLMAWTPLGFFTNAADRLLRTYTTNWFAAGPSNYLATYYNLPYNAGYYAYIDSLGRTNAYSPTGLGLTNQPFFGMTNQIPAFGVGNIPVFVNSNFVYAPAVNRLLQLAANIYDASTNSFYPSVFRPVFTNNGVNVFILGYHQIVSVPYPPSYGQPPSTQLPLSQPVDVSYLLSQPTGTYSNNIYGVPWIIGAKKNLPGFNQFSMVNAVQVTRKLQVGRTKVEQYTVGTYGDFWTNQMYLISINNNLGASFWNSYTKDYPTNYSGPLKLSVYVSDAIQMVLTNSDHPTTLTSGVLFATNYYFTPAVWPGSQWSANGGGTPAAGSFIATNWINNFFPVPVEVYKTGVKQWALTNDSDVWETNNHTMYPLPQFGLLATNWVQAVIVDNGNVIDYVQLRGPIDNANLNAQLADPFYSGSPRYQWSTNTPSGAPPAWGVINQMIVSRGLDAAPGANSWVSPSQLATTLGYNGATADEASYFNAFFTGNYATNSQSGKTNQNEDLINQAPYTPSRTIYVPYLLQVNDPLVHYMVSDLNAGAGAVWANTSVANGVWEQSDNANTPLPASPTTDGRYQPWSKVAPTALQTSSYDFGNAYNLIYKDPLVWASDYWDFPTNRYPTVGWIGRVHRGTPWQTVYLKASDILKGPKGPATWGQWTGDAQYFDAANSAPVQDRQLFDLFTTRFNDNAAHGTLSVNQANLAAWSALFSGMVAISNSFTPPRSFMPIQPAYSPLIIPPAGGDVANSAVGRIASSINNTRMNTSLFPFAAFTHVGDILSAPALTEQSPFLHLSNYVNNVWVEDLKQKRQGISDEVYEWLPQQALGLLRVSGSTRYVVYCYGQTLRPAVGGTVLSGNYFNLVTNYQITAESATRAVIRVDRQVTATGTNYSTVVESFNPLPPN